MRRTGAIAAAVLLLAAGGAQGQGGRDRSAAPQGNPGAFFGTENYPLEAVRKGEQGRVVARLAVGPDGRVTACDVGTSSGSPSLDSTTCDIALKRVTFTPAKDRRGRAVASVYWLPVRWVLPDANAPPPPLPRISYDQQFQLEIAADDTLFSCRFMFNGINHDAAMDGPGGAFCASVRRMGPVQLRAYKGDLAGNRALVTFQSTLAFGGGQPPSLVHTASGRRTLALTRTLLDVLPDGTIANVRVVEQVGLPSQDEPAKMLRPFVAAPDNTDRVTLTQSVSVVAAP